MRSAEGGYSERHLPLRDARAYTLTARDRDEVHDRPTTRRRRQRRRGAGHRGASRPLRARLSHGDVRRQRAEADRGGARGGPPPRRARARAPGAAWTATPPTATSSTATTSSRTRTLRSATEPAADPPKLSGGSASFGSGSGRPARSDAGRCPGHRRRARSILAGDHDRPAVLVAAQARRCSSSSRSSSPVEGLRRRTRAAKRCPESHVEAGRSRRTAPATGTWHSGRGSPASSQRTPQDARPR